MAPDYFILLFRRAPCLMENASASLFNFTTSPGWTEAETDLFCRLVVRFGVGNWAQIRASGLLKDKTLAQMNLQLQRLLGQQSTHEFRGLHLDPRKVGQLNRQKTNVVRKNGMIINQGGRLTAEQIRDRIKQNRDIFEESEAVINSAIASSELDKVQDNMTDSNVCKHELLRMKKRLLRTLRDEMVTIESKLSHEVKSDKAQQSRRSRKACHLDAYSSDNELEWREVIPRKQRRFLD